MFALRLQNRRWFPFIFLGSVLLFAAIWFRFLAEHRPEPLLSGIVALAGFGHFLYRHHLDETKLFKELFVEFNARYDILNDGLNKIVAGRNEDKLSETEHGVRSCRHAEFPNGADVDLDRRSELFTDNRLHRFAVLVMQHQF